MKQKLIPRMSLTSYLIEIDEHLDNGWIVIQCGVDGALYWAILEQV